MNKQGGPSTIFTTSLRRRTFAALAGVGLALAGVLLALAGTRSGRARIKTLLAALFPAPELDPDSGVGTLSAPETSVLLALVEVILPPGAKPEGRRFLAEHIVRRASDDAGYLEEYRRAARLLDDAAGQAKFADLDAAARERVLRSLLWTYRASDRRLRQLEELWLPRECRALRELVMRDLLRAFYESHHGWAVVGYTHFPGVPAGDPHAYARALSGRTAPIPTS